MTTADNMTTRITLSATKAVSGSTLRLSIPAHLVKSAQMDKCRDYVAVIHEYSINKDRRELLLVLEIKCRDRNSEGE